MLPLLLALMACTDSGSEPELDPPPAPSTPEDGDDDVYRRVWFGFEDDEGAAFDATIEGPGGVVDLLEDTQRPGQFWPVSELAPSTAYTLRSANADHERTLSFTTSDHGTPTGSTPPASTFAVVDTWSAGVCLPETESGVDCTGLSTLRPPKPALVWSLRIVAGPDAERWALQTGFCPDVDGPCEGFRDSSDAGVYGTWSDPVFAIDDVPVSLGVYSIHFADTDYDYLSLPMAEDPRMDLELELDGAGTSFRVKRFEVAIDVRGMDPAAAEMADANADVSYGCEILASIELPCQPCDDGELACHVSSSLGMPGALASVELR